MGWMFIASIIISISIGIDLNPVSGWLVFGCLLYIMGIIRKLDEEDWNE